MSGLYDGKSLNSMTVKDLRTVLDKARVDHSQLKVKKDLLKAIGRLPPPPADDTGAGGGDGSAAAGAAAGAAFGTRLCGVAPHKMHGPPSFGIFFPTAASTNPALAQHLVRSKNQSSVTFC